jgi:NhaP-type Na+/H+ or K+/H+ antiporter
MGYILTFYPHHDISFEGNWFLRIMVPPIVFEAALSIDKRSFSRHIVPIMFYAVLGTLVATGATAIVVHEGSKLLRCETIPYAEAFTFGALISSIDPIAVLSVLSNMGMTDQDTIYVVIFGESLLNDGVAIVLFETLVHFLDDDMIVDSNAVTAATVHFLVVFAGSLLIGLGYGLGCTLYYWIMIGCQTSLVEVLMFCCWALLPYYVCDGIEWSGIVAVVAAGFIMDMYVVGTENPVDFSSDETDSGSGDDSEKNRERLRKSMARRPIFSKQGLLSKEARTHIAFVTEIIATMMETAIFAYLGLFLFSSRYHWNYDHIFIAISGCSLSRAIMIPSLSFVANLITKSQQSRAVCTFHEIHQQFNQQDVVSNRFNQAAGVVIDAKMQLVLWFAGLRGAMSFALVEHIPQYDAVSGEGTRFKSELKAMTSACIIFTVFFLGGGTFYMMEALGLSPKSKRHFTVERDTEMIGLLSSLPSIGTEDGIDNMDEQHRRSLDVRSVSSNADIYSHESTKNSFRRPGRPVRHRNIVSKS